MCGGNQEALKQSKGAAVVHPSPCLLSLALPEARSAGDPVCAGCYGAGAAPVPIRQCPVVIGDTYPGVLAVFLIPTWDFTLFSSLPVPVIETGREALSRPAVSKK
jgi:hypothetical protein